MHDVYKLLSIKKVNTTAYHPQIDGLLERSQFNHTLTSMPAKNNGKDWDEHLPYILFQYRASVQESKNHPIVWKGCSTNAKVSCNEMKLDDYGTEFSECMAAAWDSAREHIKKAQQKQKRQHDKHI